MTRKATPADQAQTLPDRILAEISWAHSRKPANADDVLALVGGDAAVFWSAVEQLKRECRINAATIKTQLDAAPWMAIWPTNLPVQHRSWKDLNAVGAFGTHPAGTIHQHMPCRRDPERDPRPDLRQVTAKAAGKQTQIHGPERRDRIATLAAGRTLEHGITFHEVAADLGISVEGVRYLVKRMADGSRVAVGKRPNEHAHRLYDPTAQAGAAPQRDAEPAADAAIAQSGEPSESDLMAVADALDAMDLAHDAPAPQARPETPATEPDPEWLPAQTLEPADLSAVADFLACVSDALGDMEPADDIDITAAAADAPAAKPCGACADGCQGTQCRLMQDSPPIHTDRINFALWDDGGLSIYDGDELLQLPPAATARLARLLGVPGSPVPAQEART